MSLPVVAIIGRPNVGKSSLFNWLAGRRISIVDPTAGVTRDRVSSLVQEGDRHFELIDTGGLGVRDSDNLTDQIESQIDAAIRQADVLLFVVDIREGPVPLDEHVNERLRGIDKPVIVAANKCDTPDFEPQAAEFHKFGHQPIVCVSAEQRRGKKELLNALIHRLPEAAADEEPAPVELQLAIVGRRNTGKSTFINCLARDERVIVSEVPGTTRDSIDVRFESDGKTFVAIDTAGVRRKKSLASDIEFYSLHRAERSIRRADVVLLFIDAQVRVSKVDKQLAQYILEHHKPAVLVMNKWDLVNPLQTTDRFVKYLRSMFPMLDYLPIAFITAKNGKNVQRLLNLAQNLHKQASRRIGTGDLNRVLREALATQPPPLRQNRRPKIFFATQTATNPPTIVLFTNGPELFDHTYQRYLEKWFRDHLPFSEVPIRLVFRAKRREGAALSIEELENEAAAQLLDLDLETAPKPRKKPRPQPEPVAEDEEEIYTAEVVEDDEDNAPPSRREGQRRNPELWNL